MCVSNWYSVTRSAAPPALGKCFATGSSVDSFPSISSLRIAAAVNCFAIDPTSMIVRSSTGRSDPSATPYPFAKITSPRLATRTCPQN